MGRDLRVDSVVSGKSILYNAANVESIISNPEDQVALFSAVRSLKSTNLFINEYLTKESE